MSLISESIRTELTRAYAAPDRHYHNLAHIEALLGLMREYQPSLADPVAVEAAIWFHDAIYDTRRNDNEARSADLAVDRLSGTASAEQSERIATMIRATADHVLPSSLDQRAAADCALFLDMDLAILASSAVEFTAYEQAVRREYSWVPEAMWIAGRRQVLEKFQARPSIYSSAQFRSRCETAARANLTRALDVLGAGEQ
jgi:predicted metal-dependent HD superfamily phosphohydrolase